MNDEVLPKGGKWMESGKFSSSITTEILKRIAALRGEAAAPQLRWGLQRKT